MKHSKLKFFIVLCIIILSTGVFFAQAATDVESEIFYTLTASDPVMNPTFDGTGSPCPGNTHVNNYHYVTLAVHVTETGTYRIDDLWALSSPGIRDGYLGLYTGPFDPNDVTSNCYATVDDELNGVPLEAGVTYTFVGSSYGVETTGDFGYRFIGPGQVRMGSAPVSDPDETAIVPFGADGRVNADKAASFVIYNELGGFHIYDPEGALLLNVTAEMIEETGCPEANTVIAESDDLRVYRLSTCEFQFVAPTLDGAKAYNVLLSAGRAFIRSFEA